MGKRLHAPRTAPRSVSEATPLSVELLRHIAKDITRAKATLEPSVFSAALHLIQNPSTPVAPLPSRASARHWQGITEASARQRTQLGTLTATRASSARATPAPPSFQRATQAQRGAAPSQHWHAQIQRYGIESYAKHYADQTDFQTRSANLTSSGEALHPVLLEALEIHFQQRLPAIQIHSDASADARARAVGALAFTSGAGIHFGAGQYQPFTPEGFKLLVHETAHVLQQMSGIVPEGIDTDPNLERAAQLEASRVSSVPSLNDALKTQVSSQSVSSQRAAPQFETAGQWAAHLLNTLKHHSVPRERFAAVTDVFAQIPADQQGKARALMLGKLNPNSSEHGRLEASLVVTPSVATKSSGSSRGGAKPRVAGELNFFTYFNPLERDIVLPNYKAFPVSSDTVKNAQLELVTPTPSRSSRTSARAPRQPFRATHATTRAIQRLASTDETPVGKRAFVREEGLNLREKPDQKASSLGTFAFGTRVLVVSQSGSWYRVATETGKSGYMLAAKIHGLQAPHQKLLEADPGLRLFRVKPGETGMQLVRRAYGITGAEGSKDQNLWHFLNAIRKRNQVGAFGFKDLGWADAAQNAMLPGADANNVLLKANTDLWIPSFVVAARDNSVGSGTVSGEARRLGKNIEQKVKDFQAAQTYAGQAMGTVFQKRLEEGAKELIGGLIPALLGAAAILVGSTVIGAIIGAFAGGVGAAPGAALGFQVGTWVLEWLGLGFLVVWGASKLGQAFSAFGSFVTKVWNANGDQQKLKEAGVALADALAILAVAALQILVTIGIAKGLGAAMKGLAGTRFGRGIGIPRLQAYLRLKLGKINRTAGSTPQTARIQTGLRTTTPRVIATRIKTRILEIPQGFTKQQFIEFSGKIRGGAGKYGTDIRTHGSRASGTARPTSDIDIAIRVPEAKFQAILAERFKSPNPTSSKWKTMQHAIETGKIQRGELGLSKLGKSLEKEMGFKVDISVVKIGGKFDKGPWIPLR